MEMLGVILGSAVISAFVTGIFSLHLNQKNSQLSYITKERIKTTKELNKLALKMSEASYDETIALLPKLKTIINAYGNSKNNRRYSEDSHIWELINEIELNKINEKKFLDEKQRLIEYINASSTYSKQLSLREVKGNWHDKLSIVLCAIEIMFGFVPFFTDNSKFKLMFGITYDSVVILILVVIIGLRFWGKDIILLNSNKFRKKTRLHRYTLFIILMVITIIISVAIFAWGTKGIVDSFEIEDFEIELYLSVLLYFIIAIIQYCGQLNILLEDVRYFNLIDDIREKYIKEEASEIVKKANKTSVKMKFDINSAISTFRHMAIKSGEYTTWKESIQNELCKFEKNELRNLKVVLQSRLEYSNKPDKFDLKTIVCNVIIPVLLAVIIAAYTIFDNGKNDLLVFDICTDKFKLLLLLMIPVIIVEHIKNKKTVMDTYAIKKLLDIIENM